jgi:hypothetical protein
MMKMNRIDVDHYRMTSRHVQIRTRRITFFVSFLKYESEHEIRSILP